VENAEQHSAFEAHSDGTQVNTELMHTSFNEAEAAWLIAGLFSLAALLTSVLLIRQHHVHFTNPVCQSKTVGILWMVPIYAVSSWLSLRFKVCLYQAFASIKPSMSCSVHYVLLLSTVRSYDGIPCSGKLLNTAGCCTGAEHGERLL
jgi:Organic solute transporter Ostalpha